MENKELDEILEFYKSQVKKAREGERALNKIEKLCNDEDLDIYEIMTKIKKVLKEYNDSMYLSDSEDEKEQVLENRIFLI